MHSFTDRFLSEQANRELSKSLMMGPNAMRLSEEMSQHLNIRAGMRILDLGCGMGLSTLYLAEAHQAKVFAADLWISPTENLACFQSLGIDDLAVPIWVDVTKGLPFAEGYFDLLFSVDAYHYFGGNSEMLPSLIRFVKPGGQIAIAIPGLKYEFGEEVPVEMQPFWREEVAQTIHSTEWWSSIWQATPGLVNVDIREMSGCGQAWQEWLACDSPYAVEDIEMMEAEAGRYFNFILLIAQVC